MKLSSAPTDVAEIGGRRAATVINLGLSKLGGLLRARDCATVAYALRVRCSTCQGVSDGTFPAEAPMFGRSMGHALRALAVYLVEQQLLPYERACEVVADICGAPLSEGTLATWLQQSAEALAPVEEAIKTALGQAAVLHHDGTGVRRAGKLTWAHVTLYRSIDTLSDPRQAGTRGDRRHWHPAQLPGRERPRQAGNPIRPTPQCRHALCNVHHLRELT